MKPTEQDIQAELDRNKKLECELHRFVRSTKNPNEVIYFDVKSPTHGLDVTFFPSDDHDILHINCSHEEEDAPFRLSAEQLLSGDYDNPPFKLHYTDWYWNDFISMCERIVRLITGEQVEQTLEEKVRKILEPAADFSELKVTDHSVEFLDNSNPAIWYFVTATEISYAPKGALSSRNTFTVSEYQKIYTGILEINAALPKIAALLTPSDQPEQTLEEAVMGLLPDCAELVEFNCDPIVIKCPGYVLKVSSELIWWRHDEDGVPYDWKMCCLDKFNELIHKDLYDKLPLIAAEIKKRSSKRSTKPSYSELEQRVEELEKGVKLQTISANCDKENVQYWRRNYEALLKTTSDLEQKYSALERENASLLDRFGPIDQAEQQVAEVETRFQKLAKKAERIADIMIQLNEEIL